MRETTLNAIEKLLMERVRGLIVALEDLNESSTNNSQSTAGNKHDTERAMVHIEIEQLSKRLEAEKKTLFEFEKLPRTSTQIQVEHGSIVMTDRGTFLIGPAFGKMQINADTFVMGISLASPLASVLLHKQEGDKVSLNGIEYRIEVIH